MKHLMIAATVVLLSACSTMTPAEKAVANLAKESRSTQKELDRLKDSLKETTKQRDQLQEENKVLKRYIEEMRK